MNITSIFSNSQAQSLIKSEFESFIPKKFILRLMESCQRIRDFDPITTLHCFLFQTMEGVSCKAALAHLNLIKVKNGLRTVSMNTAAYCRARKKIIEKYFLELCLYIGNRVEDNAKLWQWKNRIVKLVDGTTITMSDTQENQKEYPQIVRQKAGLGWPIMRVLGVFGLSSGAILDLEIGKYAGKGQGEPSLLKRMLDRFNKQDILLMDRYFTSFFLHCDLIDREIDFVIRIRDRTGERHLKGKQKDEILSIKKPHKHHYTNTGSCREYHHYPKEKELRVIKSSIVRKGFRTKTIYIITSLTDKKMYPKSEIEELYSERWGVELDFRNLKQTIKADFLSCKTPEMVRKELYMKIIGYNLIRKIMVCSCNFHQKERPRKISFMTTLHLYLSSIKILGVNGIIYIIDLLKTEQLSSKYRREPRAIKKRKKAYPLLTVARQESKEQDWGYKRRIKHA